MTVAFDGALRGRPLARIKLSSGEVWSEFSREGNAYTLDWKQAARFQISKDGRNVRCAPRRNAAKVSLRVLERLVHAYAGSLRGEESLHATTLSFKGEAIALLGDSGAGKSTLASQLAREGWRLLSDDTLPFEIRSGMVWVRSCSGRLKLSQSAVKRVLDIALEKEFDPNLEKWIVKLPTSRGVLRLRGAILLRREAGGDVSLRRLRGAENALVFQASFYNEVLRPRAVLRRQFSIGARLSRHVPLWRLRYPSGFNHLSQVTGAIRTELERQIQ